MEGDGYSLDNFEQVGATLDALGDEDRVRTYDLLTQGYSATEIAEEIGREPTTVHAYREEFEDQGWLEGPPGSEELTEEGEMVHDVIQELDEAYDEMV
jgi:DNA-binding transcriptional ArsR family regulator